MVRVEVLDLFPALSGHLTSLLTALSPDEWVSATSCPGWTVHDVVAHLLGVEAANVSIRRDGWRAERGPEAIGGLAEWNERWVDACRRVSPAVLTELIRLEARSFADHMSTLDLDAAGGPVGWATGDVPAPVWLDVGREYMERCVHQMQIRSATERDELPPHLVGPVVGIAVHALPVALDRVARPVGTTVVFRAEGAHGGVWTVTREEAGWRLSSGAVDDPAAHIRTTVDGAVRLFVGDPASPEPDLHGDGELAQAARGAKAILD